MVYSLCFYPLAYRYFKKSVRVILYFTKSSLKGFVLHSIVTNFSNLLLGFVHCYLYTHYSCQIRVIVAMTCIICVFTLLSRHLFLNIITAVVYGLFSAVFLTLNLVLLQSQYDPSTNANHAPAIAALIIVLIALSVIKVILSLIEVFKGVRNDWKTA